MSEIDTIDMLEINVLGISDNEAAVSVRVQVILKDGTTYTGTILGEIPVE